MPILTAPKSKSTNTPPKSKRIFFIILIFAKANIVENDESVMSRFSLNKEILIFAVNTLVKDK